MQKRFLLIFLLAFGLSQAFSLVGFNAAQPDFAGDFVYYRDYTFKTETYIGVLYYDDATYALRYYSPSNEKEELPTKDIMILFSIEPNNPKLTFTGEKIIGEVTDNDVDTVNYIHDMFYEFTSHRQKASTVSSHTIFGDKTNVIQQDFAQFGGAVEVYYNKIVPVFNIYAIKSLKGEDRLSLICIGTLSSSSDESFSKFTGIKDMGKSPKAQKIKPKKNTRDFTYNEVEVSQTLSLDPLWQKLSDNVCTLTIDNKQNVLVLLVSNFEESVATYCMDALCRSLLQSSDNCYTDIQNSRLFIDKNQTNIDCQIADYNENRLIRSITKIIEFSPTCVAIVNLTVDNAIYEANKKYFTAILATHKATFTPSTQDAKQ